jgi:outer membrane protein
MLTSHVEAADIMDVYNRSLNFNNDLKMITNDQKISQEIYNQTSSNIFPEVSIIANTQEINVNKYTGTGTQKDYSTESASLTVTQPLLRLYFFDELNKAESIVKKSEINLEEFKKDLIVKSAELYFNLINAKNSVAAGEVKLDSMLIKYESAKKLFDNGYISDIELNKYRNNYEMTMVEKQILVNELDMVKQDVYIFTGREILDIHNLNHTIEIPLSTYDANSLISKALVSFDSIKSALLDVNISRDEMKSNKSKHYPTIDLNATYDYSDTSSGSRLGKQTRESNTIGLTINIPIYQGGFQKSKVTEARYKYKNAKINLDHLRRTVRKEILDNINNHNLLKSLVIVKRDRYDDVNQDYLTISHGGNIGLYTDVEIKDAEYNLMVAKNDLIESTLDLLLVDLNLKKYSSNLSVENIKTINRMLVW